MLFLAGRQPASVYLRPLALVRIFRVASSRAARSAASVLSLDSAPAPVIGLRETMLLPEAPAGSLRSP